MDWGFHLVVVLAGLVIVFAVLLILVVCCWLMGLFFQKKKGKPAVKQEKKEEPVKAVKQAEKPAPQVQAGISGEVVAAIAGALACMLGDQGSFRVRSIRRAKGSRPAWNAAAISENTRPF